MRFLPLLLLSLVLVSCQNKPGSFVPTRAAVTAGTFGPVFQDADGKMKRWGTDTHGVRVLYICDTTMGPPAPGHCFTDGSGCVDPYPGTRWVAAPSPTKAGDPTGDDVKTGEPTVGDDADNDSVLLK